MDFKVVAKCVLKQGTGLVVHDAGNNLPAMAVIMCKMTPFVITEDGDTDNLAGRRMESVYQADDQYFKFFENQVRELHAERSQGIFASVFKTLIGRRHKTRRRQVMGLPPTPMTMVSTASTTAPYASVTPINAPEVPVTTTP